MALMTKLQRTPRSSLRRIDSLRIRERWWWRHPDAWGRMLMAFGLLTFLVTLLIVVSMELDPQERLRELRKRDNLSPYFSPVKPLLISQPTRMDGENLSTIDSAFSALPLNWEDMNVSFSLWRTAQAEEWGVCPWQPKKYSPPPLETDTNGYLVIAVAGGLNQMRLGVCDAVVVARLLNATLLLPEFDNDSWWMDQSEFKDVFNVELFVERLAPDVRVLQKLPEPLRDVPHYTKTVPRHSSKDFYLKNILPILKSRQILRLKHFDFRLADDIDDIQLQQLRCRANYHALGFAPHLEEIGRRIVEHVRGVEGPFIALHLRFESDMLAFTMCNYGGGAEEMKTLAMIRKRWPNLRKLSPENRRRKGVCVLTPEEVGRSLVALGYPKSTYIYIASGPIYGGEKALAPLRDMYPNLTNKSSLVAQSILGPLGSFASQLAAIDYYVCFHADVFVSNNNGNMARMLAGHRRYAGHKRTIRLHGAELLAILDYKKDREFNTRIQLLFDGRAGEPGGHRVKDDGGFYSFPSECICQKNSTHGWETNLRMR